MKYCLTVFCLLCLLIPAVLSAQSYGPVWVSEPCVPSLTIAVRDLPPLDEKAMDDQFGVEAKRRDDHGFTGPDIDGEPFINPLAVRQDEAKTRDSRAFGTPILNFEGLDYNVYPPDPTGDVGYNYAIQGVNGTNSTIRILTKAGGTVTSFELQDLATGSPCTNGFCDPVVLYDSLDDRWLVAEFDGGGDDLCIYLSETSDPTGSWYYYTWNPTGTSVDYYKIGVWHDAYYISANNSNGQVYAIDKGRMLDGLSATLQEFYVGTLSGWGFQLSMPASCDGTTPPPAGSPGIFLRPRDTEIHGGTCSGCDLMEMWEVSVDFITPANSSITQLSGVEMTDWDQTVCGTSAWNCMPQSGTSQLLDPIREPIHFPLQYRNWGSYETLVGSFVVDIDGTNQAAVEWFEIRRDTGDWYIYQEGVTPNDAYHRSVSCAAMDGSGNIAVGYTRTSSSSYPSSYYAGRCADDTLGTLQFIDNLCYAGSGYQQGTERWGDYAGIGLDPADDATFWWFGMYEEGNNNSATRICTFRFDECTPSCATVSASIDTVSPNPACVGQSISFSGSGTGEGSLSYAWDWTDDGTWDASGANQSHTYATANTYTVRFRVQDSCADPGTQTAYDTVSVTVNATPGTPSITIIADDDDCAQSGIRISYNSGSMATSHNLLRNGSTVVTGYTSGSLYNPGDSNSYNYQIEAVNNCGSTNSGQQSFADQNNTPGAPSITTITDEDDCAQNGIRINFNSGSGASSHNLLRSGSLVVTGYTSGALYNPGSGSSFSYSVQAVNGTCTNDSPPQNFTDADNTPTPTITGLNANACPATTVGLSTETGMSNYQWYESGAPIGGAQSDSYTVASSGSYTVSYTNSFGCTGTSGAHIVTISACVPNIQYDDSFDPNTTLVEICGDGDTLVEPGEQWEITLQLINTGGGNTTNVIADLALNTGSANNASITGNPAPYGDMLMGATAQTQVAYGFYVDDTAVCGDMITFDVININSDDGSYSDEIAAFTVMVGMDVDEDVAQNTDPLTTQSNSNTSDFVPTTTAPAATTSTVTYNYSYTSGGGTTQLFPTLPAGPDDSPYSSGYWTFTSASGQSEVHCSHSDAYARINRDDYMILANNLSTVGYTNIRVHFDGRTNVADGSCELQYSTDGGNNWSSSVWSTNSTTWQCDRDVALPASCEGITNLRIRFLGNGRRGYVDYVSITGDGGGAGSWTDSVMVEFGEGGSFSLLKDYGDPDANPYDVTSLYSGVSTYQIRITEQDGGQAVLDSGVLNVQYAECDISSCQCDPPTGLNNNSAVDLNGACADDGVEITWDQDPSDWADGGSGTRTYDVLRDGTPLAAGTGIAYGTTTFVDTTGVDGTSYDYSVRYNNGCNNSAETTGVSAADVNDGPGTPGTPVVTDNDPCVQDGVIITFTAAPNSPDSYDLYVDTVLEQTGFTSGSTYNPADLLDHDYVIRAHKNGCWVNSGIGTGADGADDPGTPGTPTITDIDNCQQNGVTISFSAAPNSPDQHDLYVDTVLAQANFTSGSPYNPGDVNPHDYVIRAIKGSCFSDSGTRTFSDIDNGPGIPGTPTVTDIDACQLTGVTITFSAAPNAPDRYDLYVDTALVQTNFTSGATYTPGNDSSHNYVIRAIKGGCFVDSGVQPGTDVNDAPGTPGTPTVTDIDACLLSGVSITFSAAPNAPDQYDLYVDTALAQTNFTSGSTYNPVDDSSHNYVIRAIKGTCFADSGIQAGTDVNDDPGTPVITGISDNDACLMDGIVITYDPGPNAPDRHDLYMDATLAVTGYISGTLYTPNDTTSHGYYIQAVKGSCSVDSAEESGTDQDLDLPGSPTLSSPANGATGVSVNPTLSWSVVADANSYYLEVSTDPTFVTTDYTATVGGNSHTVATPLTSGILYYWRVTAINVCGNGVASAPWSFTTSSSSFTCGALIDFDAGIPTDWTVIDNEGTGVVWGALADCQEGGNYTGGSGDPACASSDEAGTAEYDTELHSPPFDLTGLTSASVTYLANYINLDTDFLDVDISTDGGTGWTNLLSWNEDHGTFRGTPGESVEIDLSAYIDMTGLILRWHYYNPDTGDWDWYAQIDNVQLNCEYPGPEISVDPSSLSSTQPPSIVRQQIMTISNTGGAGLSWNIDEEPGKAIAERIHEKSATADVAPIGHILPHPRALSDELFQIDAESSTGHGVLLGVEYADGYYWVTSAGATGSTDDNYIFQLDASGTVVGSWLQGTASEWGWRDLAYDGTYLYASDSTDVVQIDPATGQATGVTIPGPIDPCRALAYDPATDHFWTQSFGSTLYEFDRSGTVINSFNNTTSLAVYGAAWDDVSAGGPYLWLWSQDGPVGQEVTATQVDPTTGSPTGISFLGSVIGTGDNLAGGATISSEVIPGKMVFIGMHQVDSDTIVGYELGLSVCQTLQDIPWINPLPGSGTTPQGSDSNVQVYFDSTGYAAGTYQGTFCISSNDTATPLVPVTVEMNVEAVDFSDIESNYGIAWHTGSGSLRLGSLWDEDTSYALNDDNSTDDGRINPPTNWALGLDASVTMNVQGGSGTEHLVAWFDWNNDQDFNDAGEKTIDEAVVNGDNVITFTVPSNATIGVPIRQRYRLYSSNPGAGASPEDEVVNGEVEDYPGEVLTGVPREAASDFTLQVRKGTGTEVEVTTFTQAGCTVNNTIYAGTSVGALSGLHWTKIYCTVGASGPVTFDPGAMSAGELLYFVIVANNGDQIEGSYGKDSDLVERSDASGLTCGGTDYQQELGGACP